MAQLNERREDSVKVKDSILEYKVGQDIQHEVKKMDKDLLSQSQATVKSLNDLDKNWEEIFRSSKGFAGNTMKLKEFESKFIAVIEKNYRVYLPKDILRRECTSPK